MKILEKYRFENGIYIASSIDIEFESLYMEVRKREQRVYSDADVAMLPYASKSNFHIAEWKLRKLTSNKFISFLNRYNNNIKILDVGCGNGWFSANIATNNSINIYALDINRVELEQAARVFNYNNLKFIYGNIFENIFDKDTFKIITLNSSIQYFDELVTLINRLFYFLEEDGEIHILDSSLYRKNDFLSAKERTSQYYNSIGFPEMPKHYYHHTYDELNTFNYGILYDPKAVKIKFKKIFGVKDSPFPWICIKK